MKDCLKKHDYKALFQSYFVVVQLFFLPLQANYKHLYIRETEVSILHCFCILTVIFEHICQQFVVGLVDDVAF